MVYRVNALQISRGEGSFSPAIPNIGQRMPILNGTAGATVSRRCDNVLFLGIGFQRRLNRGVVALGRTRIS